VNFDDAPLESAPTDLQKNRLERWLGDLQRNCNRNRIALESGEDGDIHVVDLERGTVIGVGMDVLLRTVEGQVRISALDCEGSILDGVWLIDTPEGPREQREVS
jgi:hypothetical protein